MALQTIVVADDDAAIAALLRHHFERAGFAVVVAADGQTAVRRARCADVLLLDVGLPVIDGFEVARALRRECCGIAIVMLTARTDEIDRIVGLELGVDDYVCKPFSPREVVARVRAVVRRSGLPPPERRTTLHFGRLEIDERAREVRVDGTEVALKPREFALLLEFAGNPGVALSRERLLQKVWGFDFDGDERTVDVHVRRLRAKLEEPWNLAPLVRTVHGVGYKFQRPA